MTTFATPPGPPPAGSGPEEVPGGAPGRVLAGMGAAVGELSETLWAAQRPEALVETLTEIERVKSRLEAVELAVVAEVEASGAGACAGWASTKDLVTAVGGGHRGYGPATVRLAGALGERTATAEALAAGRISRAQAGEVVRAVDALPRDRPLRVAGEQAMLDHARTLHAGDLARAGRHLAAVVDPDGDERRAERELAREERAAHLDRFLAVSPDGAGGVRVRGRGSVEDAAVLKAALLPLTSPETSTRGACGGPTNCPDECCAHDGSDPRDHGARLWDGLVETAHRVLGTESLPAAHGASPRLSLTMPLADLVEQTGQASVETGERVSAATARRLACDAEVVPLVLGGAGEVLDVGRTHRLVTAAIWKALVVRDHGCTFPGCTRPPIMCQAHHIRHWADGGTTSLDNLALLCRAHHTLTHRSPWQIRLDPHDHRPEYLPPARLDPHRRPTRHRHPRE